MAFSTTVKEQLNSVPVRPIAGGQRGSSPLEVHPGGGQYDNRRRGDRLGDCVHFHGGHAARPHSPGLYLHIDGRFPLLLLDKTLPCAADRSTGSHSFPAIFPDGRSGWFCAIGAGQYLGLYLSNGRPVFPGAKSGITLVDRLPGLAGDRWTGAALPCAGIHHVTHPYNFLSW